jgi:hypothetical protein
MTGISRTVRIGCGAGYAGDRIEPAVELAERGELDYLVFECLAERTIALAQQEKRYDAARGFDPLLGARLRAVLRACHARETRIITNSGAAHPAAAAELAREVARELRIRGLRIAVVEGDDVLELVRAGGFRLRELDRDARDLGTALISANAYLGAAPIVEALADRADVVITGRVADPALFLAPLVHEFGWPMDDWKLLGRGTVVGHLLECAGQVTGGYFVDPGFSDVPGLARLGFPIGEVAEDGSVVITKVPGSGGRVTEATCREQLLYEIEDPARYLTPDVTVDFTGVTITELEADRVAVAGGDGSPAAAALKVSVGYFDGFVGEGQISYAGPGAVARGRLALEILAERLRITRVSCTETRFDLVGMDALHGAAISARGAEPHEVRVRVAARTTERAQAERIGNEVEALYTNGPAGGGGVAKSVREVVAVASTFVPREHVRPTVSYLES